MSVELRVVLSSQFWLSFLQWKVAASLAAGNTIVLKPSEMASITCLELADVAEAAGLPSGVFNVVTGTGQEAGAPLRSNLKSPSSPVFEHWIRILPQRPN